MKKEVYTEKKVHCYYNIEHGSTLKHCKDCSFFNGFIKEDESKTDKLKNYTKNNIVAVDCLRGDIGNIRAHVTSFKMGDYLYKSRYYDENIDGKIEGDDPYDFCQKCCFNKKLINGQEICTLRCGIDDESSNFMCYEGEIWEKEKFKDTDD